MKKIIVLSILFVFPLVAYLFFASGVNNFAKLPVLTQGINNVDELSSLSGEKISLDNKITILGFFGKDVANKKGNAFNLNQKIYKRFYEFHDFQFVIVQPKGTEPEIQELKNELQPFTDTKNWKFVFAEASKIQSIFNSLQSNLTLEEDLSIPYVFIIDKDRNLRGRKGDETVYGFDATSVAEINNKMEDDVKVILAEYRMALKKNNVYKEK
ncbi:hypothetical protein [Leptobacterium sp. I13]|uniref:hypothetical protein n=1 Tax=Leptobacterium meishanense TaxID=3128904 RepID=UPI0030EEADF3